jgi:signal transduction histidine kinase
LFTDYRKSKALEAFDNIQKELKDSEKKYDESMRMLETYIRKLHESEAENKRLREALESIAKGMTINPPNEQVEGVVGYFMGFAQAVLKGKP